MPEMEVRHQGQVRVLWLTKGLGPGGAERLLASFAARADRRRFDLRAAYLLPWKDHLVGRLAELGVPTVCLDGAGTDLRWVVRLRRLVAESRIDIVHVHSPMVAALARPALRTLPGRARPGLMGTEHNVWTSHHPATAWANRLTLPLEDVTIAVSEEVRSSMPPRLRARTEVVIQGVEVDAIATRRAEREAARLELGISPDEIVIVTVANLRANKDYPTLLRAASELVASGASVRFLSVGQGPLADQLASERDRLRLGDRFRFLGYREDPVRVLVAADVFCLSSRFEGLPIALLEAMAAGLPVVVTRVGGIPAVVTDGREGRLVAPGDAAELARALADLLPSDARAAYASAAWQRVQDFAVEGAVRRQQELYEQLLARVRLRR